MNENEVKDKLRMWIADQSESVSDQSEVKDDTAILESRILTSLQVMDLILFIQSLSPNPIQIDNLKPGVFSDINAIYSNFFRES